MTPTSDAVLRSWPSEPWVVVSLLLTAAIYLRGWLILRRRGKLARRASEGGIKPSLARRANFRWTGWRLAAFLGGLGCVFLALASPVEPFSALLLQVHMAQHLLLMMAAPPLLWLGYP